MSFELAEELKHEWTDQFVQVDDEVAELKRFAGLTGQVKTVNMSGQVLVEFEGSEDIGWYDIHPRFLKIVASAPVESPEPEATDTGQEATTTETAAETAKPTAAPSSTTDILAALRAEGQGEGGEAVTETTQPAAQPAAQPDHQPSQQQAQPADQPSVHPPAQQAA